jgi:hypothetical protein
MWARQPATALSACVLAMLAACGQAFTAGGSGGDGGEDASSDSPGVGEASSGGDAVTGDADADAVAHDDGPAPPDAPSSDAPADSAVNDGVVGPSKLVFITSHLYTGNLGGLAGADSQCQKLATTASLPGTFKAWLSSMATTASERLTHSTGPYVLTDGTRVASSWAGLTSGTLLHAIDLTETGKPAPIPTIMCGSANILPSAWTSTAPDGGLAGQKDTCADWATNGLSYGATLGVVGQTNATWTAGCGSESSVNNNPVCESTASLYCIEQ